MAQTRSSANTSVNSVKLPSAFTHFTPYGHIMDYGCGKFYNNTKKYCDEYCLSYHPFDVFNCPNSENEKTIAFGENHGFNKIYCCNVLNVIDDVETIMNIIKRMYTYLVITGTIYIQIYEGDKTGVGRETKYDCYQRNAKTVDYIDIVRDALKGCDYYWYKECNFIVITKM